MFPMYRNVFPMYSIKSILFLLFSFNICKPNIFSTTQYNLDIYPGNKEKKSSCIHFTLFIYTDSTLSFCSGIKMFEELTRKLNYNE